MIKEFSKNKKLGYREIKESILGKMRGGTWPPGSFLPKEIELSEQFGCSRTTINRALRELADEGLIERRRKAGTKVIEIPSRQAKFQIPSIRAEIEATGAEYRYHLFHRESIPVPGWLCGRFGIKKDVRVLHLYVTHYADNDPFQFEERWINLTTVPEAENEQFQHNPPSEWLVQAKPFSDIELMFSASGADKVQSEYLGVSVNDPLLVSERATWLKGDPVTYARLSFKPGYKMRTKL